jgi:hypothetical protein
VILPFVSLELALLAKIRLLCFLPVGKLVLIDEFTSFLAALFSLLFELSFHWFVNSLLEASQDQS